MVGFKEGNLSPSRSLFTVSMPLSISFFLPDWASMPGPDQGLHAPVLGPGTNPQPRYVP